MATFCLDSARQLAEPPGSQVLADARPIRKQFYCMKRVPTLIVNFVNVLGPWFEHEISLQSRLCTLCSPNSCYASRVARSHELEQHLAVRLNGALRRTMCATSAQNGERGAWVALGIEQSPWNRHPQASQIEESQGQAKASIATWADCRLARFSKIR